jgi:hypothetical protein
MRCGVTERRVTVAAIILCIGGDRSFATITQTLRSTCKSGMVNLSNKGKRKVNEAAQRIISTTRKDWFGEK